MSIDFTGVKAVTVPEGAVKKITRKSDGVVLWEKQTIPSGFIYRLDQPLACTGTQYIGTGIKLLETNTDFSIVCKFTCLSLGSPRWRTLFNCMYEASPYPGITVDNNNVSSAFIERCVPWDAWIGASVRTVGSYTFVVTAKASSALATTYIGLTGSNSPTIASDNYTYSTVNSTLVIAAYKTTGGAYGRFFNNGSIDDFVVYKRTLSDAEARSFFAP